MTSSHPVAVWTRSRKPRAQARVRAALRNALALARALGRVLGMPRIECYCERFWWLLKDCRIPDAEKMPLPFACPMDQIFEPLEWFRRKIPFREAGAEVRGSSGVQQRSEAALGYSRGPRQPPSDWPGGCRQTPLGDGEHFMGGIQ